MKAAAAPPTVARETFRVFGTTATLLLTDAAALPAARELADAELAAVDLACSRFRADSELTRVNEADGGSTEISPLLATLIGEALRAARLTAGDVDPTCATALTALGYDRDFDEVKARAQRDSRGDAASAAAASSLDAPAGRVPGWRKVELSTDPPRVTLTGGAQLDLGATAKAWAADRCAEVIAAQLGCAVLVSLGGDIAVAGEAPAGGWRVRVTDDHAAGPDAPGQTVAINAGVQHHGAGLGEPRPQAAPHHRPGHRQAGPVHLADGQRGRGPGAGRQHRQHGLHRPRRVRGRVAGRDEPARPAGPGGRHGTDHGRLAG
jgi:thiamine biosynthesis lipoprotein